MKKRLLSTVLALGVLLGASISQASQRTDVGVIGPDGEVILYYKNGDYIIVKACDFDAFPPEILGSTTASARQNCQGKTNKIPLETFKQALRDMVSADRLNVLKPLTPEEISTYRTSKIDLEQSKLDQLEAWEKELTTIENFIAFTGEVDAGSKVARKIELLELINTESIRINDIKEFNHKIDSAIELISNEVEKAINLIADNSTLTLKRFSKDKGQFLYTVLKQFNPNQKFPCGLKGSVEERIRDCSYQLTSEKGGFVLVTRTKEFKEVHKETKTGLLWGDRLPSTMTHYNAEKACKADLAEVAKISDVTWRLPTKQEYEEAEQNGIRKALPNMNSYFWSSSVHDSNSNYAWLFSGDGNTFYFDRDYVNEFSVRCVAR